MCKTMFTMLGTLVLIAAPAVAQQTPEGGQVEQQQTGQQQTGQQQTGQQQTEQQQTERRRAQQQRAERAQPGQRQPGQRQAGRQPGQRGPAMRASDITGLDVRNEQNEDLGSIDDLVIDLQTGQIRYAALSVGGVLGIGDDLFAVPWNAFRLRAVDGDYHLVLNATEQQLENAPGFDKDNWPNMADPQWRTTNDAFYVERGITTARREGVGRQDQDRVRQDGVRPGTERQDRVRPGTDPQDRLRPRTDRQDGARPRQDTPQRDN